MTRDEIDVMWQQALHQSVQDGEQFTRYRFAALVAAKEREECAMVCESYPSTKVDQYDCAEAIRERKP